MFSANVFLILKFMNHVLRERLLDKNGWKHYFYHQADTNVHYLAIYVVRAQIGWDRDINDFVTTTQVQVTVNTFQCCATVKQF